MPAAGMFLEGRLSYGRGGREQPFPCREDADGFAVAGEGVFLVVGDDEEVVAAGGTGGFEDACDFPFTGSGVFHVPSGLEELQYLVFPPEDEVAFVVALVVADFVGGVF